DAITKPIRNPTYDRVVERQFSSKFHPIERYRIHVETIADDRPPDLTPQFVAIVPTTELAYRGVFGEAPSAASEREMTQHATGFRQLGANVISSEQEGVNELLELIRNARNANPLIIVGHSERAPGEEDGILILPDGTRIAERAI